MRLLSSPAGVSLSIGTAAVRNVYNIPPSTRAPLGSGESHILLAGEGILSLPPVISQTTGPIPKIRTLFDSPVRELSKHGVKFDLEVTDDVTGQIKVRMFNFSGLVTSASAISILTENKADESAWIVSLTFVSINSSAL